MKKTILGIILVLALAVGGAIIYVINIDWSEHKDKIAEQFYNSTGKYIVFDGSFNFNIFPTPYLEAVNAKVYNTKNKTGKPLLDIKSVNAELALVPLLKGEFNISKMVLDGASININWDDKGLNWQGDLSADQRQVMEDTNMVLNSVSLKNAKVNFEASKGEINFSLDNLSGEVVAQSIFGPFRVEGNYIKDEVLQGFAITVGKLDESMPTTLNAVLTHPKSNSYVRFDGTFQLTNKVLNGNVIVESQKLSDFVNDNIENVNLIDVYNKPLVLGFDIAINKQMMDFSNVVLKYEDTQGAGSMKLPIGDLNKPRVKINFEFADLSLDPMVDFVRNFVEEHKEKTYTPYSDMEFEVDIRAMRASYDGQTFKDFVSSFEVNENGFLLNNMSVLLPGNSSLNIDGNVYSYEGDVYYQASILLESDELMRLLRWMEIEPKATASSVYKKMLFTAKLSGNFDKIQVSPYKVVLDNTTFNGDFGVVLGDRKDIMLNVSADTLNFDNYINSVPDEIKSKSFAERINYRFSKLNVLNEFDMILNADSNLVIYEGLPFEGVKFKGNILQGVLDIEELAVEKVANTKFNINGKISGFGNKAQLENLQYDLNAQDTKNMIDKFGLHEPKVDYDQFSNLALKGSINGSLDDFEVNTQLISGDVIVDYNGTINIINKAILNGNIEIKHPEAVKLIEAIGLDYKPRIPNLGLFSLKSKVEGSADNLNLTEMDLKVGYSQFNGDLFYDFRSDKNIINSKLKINKIEFDKFLPKGNIKSLASAEFNAANVSFLPKPKWNKDKIDYTPYKNLEIKGDFEVGDLEYKNYMFKDAKFNLELKDGILNIPTFDAVFDNIPTKITTLLDMNNEPVVNLTVDVADANVSDFPFGEKTYNLKDGKFSTKIKLNSKASSEENFINSLSGTAEFEALNTKLSGINIVGIYNDVIKRDKSEGLADFANSQIAIGTTSFDKVVGKFGINDGVIKVVEGQLSAKNTNVIVNGECDIKNWNMDITFDINHDEPKYLQNYIFSMKNGMDNPDVNIDVSKLFNIFKAREDQKEAAEKAQEEAKKQALLEQINEQRKIAEDLVKSTKDKVNVEIDEKIKLVFSDECKKMYEDVKDELSTLLKSFLDSTLQIDNENVTLEDINTIKNFNTKAMQDIELLRNKIKDINLDDLQRQNSSEYDKIVKVNNDVKQIVAKFNEAVADYTTRLSNIITEYTLDSDERYVLPKKDIDEVINNLEKMNNEVVTARNLYSTDASIDEYEQLNAKMTTILDKIVEGEKSLNEKVNAFKETMDPVIAREEELYRKKLEDEENQRLVAEKQGSISVKKTGKTTMVTRDIEDIKEANKDIDNETVKVIDFTKKNNDVEKSSQQESKGVIKKGRINR